MAFSLQIGILADGRWHWLRALLWMVALFLVIALTLSPAAIVHAWLHLSSISAGMISAILTALAYLIYAWLAQRVERRRVNELAPRFLLADLGLGLLIGLGMFSLAFAGLRIAGLYTLAGGCWTDWPLDVIEAFATGFAEELLFRLVMFRLLLEAFGRWPALLTSAGFFGAAHLANPNATPEAALAIAVEAGLMLGAFYLLTGRIWMSVGVHTAWNFAQGSIFGAAVSGHSGRGSLFVSAPAAGAPVWASGGAFGPEASPFAMAVGAAVFVLVMGRLPRARIHSTI